MNCEMTCMERAFILLVKSLTFEGAKSSLWPRMSQSNLNLEYIILKDANWKIIKNEVYVSYILTIHNTKNQTR